MTRVLVCTPTYIEAVNIEELLHRVRAALPDADILVLDDNSPDGTADVAERVGAELGQVEVLRRPAKRGLGEAYRAGFAVGIARGYDVLVPDRRRPVARPRGAARSSIDDARAGRRPRDRVALRARRRRSRTGRGGAGRCRSTATSTRGSCCRPTCRTAPRASARTGPTRSRRSSTRPRRAKGYGFQMELAYRVVEHRRSHRRGADHVHRPGAGPLEDVDGVMVEEMTLISWWGIRDRWRKLRLKRSS